MGSPQVSQLRRWCRILRSARNIQRKSYCDRRASQAMLARMRYHVVALPGDGTGPEVMAQGLRVLRAVEQAGVASFEVESIPCGGQYYLAQGRDWPQGAEERCAAADVILLGAVGWPSPDGKGPVTMPDGRMAGWSPVLGNRFKLDLYANVRPIKMYPGIQHRIHGGSRRGWDADKTDMRILPPNTPRF